MLANIEQTSSRRRAVSTCILNTFARRLLDVCSIV